MRARAFRVIETAPVLNFRIGLEVSESILGDLEAIAEEYGNK